AACPPRARGAPSAGLTDLEPGERQHGDALLGQDLLDGLLRVLHERLLGQHDVLEERAQPALHDLADRLPGLAFVAGALLRDAPLVLNHIAGPPPPRPPPPPPPPPPPSA